jgi:exopolysaccharide production protein ExoZ
MSAALACIVLGAALLLWRSGPLSYWSQIAGAGLLLAGSLNERVMQWNSPVAQAVGDASYSIYLTHLFSLGVLRVVWTKLGASSSALLPASGFMLAGLVLSALIGWLVYRWLELPMLRRLNAAFGGGARQPLVAAGGPA